MGSRVARCRTCQAPIVFFRSPYNRKTRVFDPLPVDGRHPLAGIKAFPVQGMSAHLPKDLADQIQVQRHCTDEQAMAEVRDMTWYLLHDCPTDEPVQPVLAGPKPDPSTTTVKEINPS